MSKHFELVQAGIQLVKNTEHVTNYAKSQGNDPDQKIRQAFFDLMGTETPTKKDIRRHEVEIFEILEEVLIETYLDGVNQDEFFMRFAEVRNLAKGDSQEFFVEDDAVVIVSEHAGSHWNIRRQKMEGGTPFSVETKPHAAAVYGDFFLFVTGRLSFSRLIQKVAEGIQNKIYQEVAASFASASTHLPTQLKKTGTVVLDDLLDLYSTVEGATGSAIVLGTRKALAKVTALGNATLLTEQQKGDIAKKGIVSEMNGMILVQLPSVLKANSFDFAYDDDQLLVLSGNDDKFIKLVFEGDDMMKQVQDNTTNTDMSFEYKFITEFGTKVVLSTVFGIYTGI